jgi:hypothetical protein
MLLYITNSNLKQITNIIRLKNTNFVFIDNTLDENIEKMSIFSEFEIKRLLFIKNFILYGEEFYEKNKKIFLDNIIKRPVNKYLRYNSNPAYHLDEQCKYLNNDYINYRFDENISENLIDEYRAWHYKYEEYFLSDNEIKKERYRQLHRQRWGEDIQIPVKEKEKSNSGVCISSPHL